VLVAVAATGPQHVARARDREAGFAFDVRGHPVEDALHLVARGRGRSDDGPRARDEARIVGLDERGGLPIAIEVVLGDADFQTQMIAAGQRMTLATTFSEKQQKKVSLAKGHSGPGRELIGQRCEPPVLVKIVTSQAANKEDL
jgi:hypothetical protein